MRLPPGRFWLHIQTELTTTGCGGGADLGEIGLLTLPVGLAQHQTLLAALSTEQEELRCILNLTPIRPMRGLTVHRAHCKARRVQWTVLGMGG